MRRTASILLSTVLAGCAVSGPSSEMPPFKGNTTLDHAQQRDGFATAFTFAQTSGCSDIDLVVIDGASALRAPPTSLPTMSLIATERWVLHGCGRTYPFLVNVSGDGEGGTFVDVRRDF